MPKHWIHVYNMKQDRSKPGRTLSSVKVGDVYMSRLLIEPGVVTGNYFHKKTRVMFYVSSGSITAAFADVESGKEEVVHMKENDKVIQVPPCVAHATRNDSGTPAILVFFSDKPLRSADCYPYQLLA